MLFLGCHWKQWSVELERIWMSWRDWALCHHRTTTNISSTPLHRSSMLLMVANHVNDCIHLTAVFPDNMVSWYQNVSILDFTGAKDDGGGGDNWSYKTCKAPVKSSPPTNQHAAFCRLDALPVTQPTESSVKGECNIFHGLVHPKLSLGEQALTLTTKMLLVTLGKVV